MIIKFNENTTKESIEKVIEAIVAKYIVKHDRYSTETNSQFEIKEMNGSYYIEGKRINSHLIELEFGYEENIDKDIWILTIETSELEDEEVFVDKTEFANLVEIKEDEEVIAQDAEQVAIKKEEKVLDEYLARNFDNQEVASKIVDRMNELKETETKPKEEINMMTKDDISKDINGKYRVGRLISVDYLLDLEVGQIITLEKAESWSENGEFMIEMQREHDYYFYPLNSVAGHQVDYDNEEEVEILDAAEVEEEVLLPAGTKYEIVDIANDSDVEEMGYREIQIRFIEED